MKVRGPDTMRHQKQPSLLEALESPRDLREYDFAELEILARELRERIIATVSLRGGHLASNLGVVELAIALHRVFESPADKIVWDVGHQCYAHKLLTGRAAAFDTLRRHGGVAGFPKRAESAHDAFNTGHASTSISAALGLLAADRIAGGRHRVAAVIGDGALTGGLAYEALSHAGQLGLPLVVILNDNKMSIGPNVGALSKYLSRLSMTAKYQTFRRNFDALVKKIPGVGELFFRTIVRLKRAVKAVFYIDNFFVDLGFEYVGAIDGHDIPRLERVLLDAKNLRRPVVVHVITRKGRGFAQAERDPSAFHGVTSFAVSGRKAEAAPKMKTFTAAFTEAILEAAARDSRVVAVTAAMESGTGLGPFKKAFPERFFDAGIAEEHAITFSCGLAAAGGRPIAALYSTFLQRSTDQVIHDAALQNLPIIVACDRAGFVSGDGETHQGLLFDITLFRSVPNLTLLAPATAGELALMLRWSLKQSGPVIIRYPKAEVPPEEEAFLAPIEAGRGIFVTENWRECRKLCIMFTGSLYQQAKNAAFRLQTERKIAPALYNARFLGDFDTLFLAKNLSFFENVLILEEGIVTGGFGEAVSLLAGKAGLASHIRVLGAEKRFFPHGTREELLAEAGLDAEGIVGASLEMLKET